MANEIRHLPKIENNNINSNYNNSQKTKKCPYCKNTMDKNEKVCSTCGKKYPSKLSTAIATILLVFIIFEFGSCVSSCSSSDSDTIENRDIPVVTVNTVGTGNPKIFDTLAKEYTTDINAFDEVKIEYDNSDDGNIYIVYLTKYGTSETFQKIKKGQEDISIWNDIVDALTAEGANSYNKVKAIESDANVIINLMNDLNEELALIIITDGILFHNELNDNQDNQDTLVTSTIIAGTDNGNLLMACDVIVIDILNGSMDNVIGQRAEVHISKDDLLSITENEFIEFTENVVVPSGYNWFTIICDDGTGINFVGSNTNVIEYGKLDDEGRINTLIEDIDYNAELTDKEGA